MYAIHTIVSFDKAPNITAPTPNITVLNGSSVTLTCVLQEGGSPAATIKWMFSGNAISTNSKYTIADNSTQLNIDIVNTSDAGIYYCQATNIAGSSTAAITLQVQGLLFWSIYMCIMIDYVCPDSIYVLIFYFFLVVPAIAKPVSPRVNVVINNTASISFTISNRNELIGTYTTRWEFRQLGSDKFSYLDHESTALTDDDLKLILQSAQLHHRGTYMITVSNPAGSTTATTDLDVFGKYM